MPAEADHEPRRRWTPASRPSTVWNGRPRSRASGAPAARGDTWTSAPSAWARSTSPSPRPASGGDRSSWCTASPARRSTSPGTSTRWPSWGSTPSPPTCG
ncbi:hypothetical protein B7486_67650, partial [cyanobacterium TDX16]